MVDRLPPLTALRAFEAAARHMSFAAAADELNVTPAALSFQIKSLEEHLGAPLFNRLNRAVSLTELGQSLAPGTSDGFAALTAAWRATRRMLDNQSLTVTSGPAYTAKWLAPRIFNFAQEHPEIDLKFSATLKILDFDRDDVDIAIRFGMPRDEPGLYSKCLYKEWLTPMMTPELAERYPNPEDMLNAPLLHQEDISLFKPRFDWPVWFAAAGLPNRQFDGVRFSQADHAIDAAISGAGVILGRITLTERDLTEGRLIAPYATAITTEAHCRLVCPAGHENRPHVRAFIDWLIRESQKGDSHRAGREFVAAADLAALGFL